MIRGVFQSKDLQAAQWVHLRPRRAIGFAGIAVVALALLGEIVLLLSGPPPELKWILWAMPISLAYFALNFGVWLPYRSKRTFKQRKDLQREAAYEPLESGLTVENENGKATKPWNDYLKWKEGKQVFLLYLSDNMFQVIPKHFFASDAEVAEFRSLLHQKVRHGEA